MPDADGRPEIQVHGMPFSGPMVRALWREVGKPGAGKTQTRRVVTAYNSTVNGNRYTSRSPAWTGLDFDRAEVRTTSTIMDAIVGPENAPYDQHLRVPWMHPEDRKHVADDPDWWAHYRVRPIYEVGDLIWVRETWKPHSIYAHMPPRDVPKTNVFFRADERYAPSNTPWRPSIHMPRWASRFTLRLTGIRAQRVQEISHEDAIAEGIQRESGAFMEAGWWDYEGPKLDNGEPSNIVKDPIQSFRGLWNSLNDKRGYGWDVNRFVWPLTFEVIPENVDVILLRAVDPDVRGAGGAVRWRDGGLVR